MGETKVKVLHFIESTPSAGDVMQANKARLAGVDYVFADESYALDNDAQECDQVVTENADLLKKYKGKPQFGAPEKEDDAE